MSIKMNSLREFYSIVDMLLLTIKIGSDINISVEYSGTIISGSMTKFNTAEVRDGFGMANIIASYVDDELIVKSVTSKKVATWIMENTKSIYKRVNNYLPFLCNDSTIYISRIVVFGEDILDDISENGAISVSKLSKYIIDETDYKSIKYNLVNGKHCITLIYSNDCFIRFVKLDRKNTLYINNPDSIATKFKGFYIDEYFIGPSLPDLNTQINMYEFLSDKNNEKFTHVIS